MSMTSEGVIKFNSSMSFTNIQPQGPEKFPLSVVPTDPHKFTWSEDFPESLKSRAQKTMHGIYGTAVDGVHIEGYRMCW
jgi:hypothetical protein